MPEIKKNKLSPQFFFLSLGVVITLITTFSQSLSLFFSTLDLKMPDTLDYSQISGSILYTVSILIIAFPLFLILSSFWNKFISKGLEGKDEGLFKWTIYIILFLSALVMMIDLITLVNYFISGETTLRFIYKVLGTAVLSGLTFTNYFLFLKNLENKKLLSYKKLKTTFTVISICLVIALIIFSFVVTGSPKKQRALRMDSQRISDLQNIQGQVLNYWQNKKVLPNKLEDLGKLMNYSQIPQDPESNLGKGYEYTKVSDLSFELCANFEENIPKSNLYQENYPKVAGLGNNSWSYEQGRYCFDRTIDPDLYK